MKKENTISGLLRWIYLSVLFVLLSVCFCMRQFSVPALAEILILLLIPALHLIHNSVFSSVVCVFAGIVLMFFSKEAYILYFSVPVCFLLQKMSDDPTANKPQDTLCKAGLTVFLIAHLVFCAVSFEPMPVLLVEWPVVVCLLFTSAVIVLHVVFLLKEKQRSCGMKKRVRFWKTVSFLLPIPSAAATFAFAVSRGLAFGYPQSFFIPFVMLSEWGLFLILAAARKESAAHSVYEKIRNVFTARFLS